MNNCLICMENGEPLSQELLNIPKSELQQVVRKEKITDVEFKTESVSYGKDVWRRFIRSKVTIVATVIILLIVLMGIVGPYISPHDYLTQKLDLKYMPPRIPVVEKLGILDGTRVLEVQESEVESYGDAVVEDLGTFEVASAFGSGTMARIRVNMYIYKGIPDTYYWFGTDTVGRDMFSRLWQGTRVSLILAFAVVAINLSVGLVVGAICGYYGGWVDLIIQRLMDVVWNIPSLPLTILLILKFGTGVFALIVAFCLTGWMGTANGVRMQFYRYKNREYVLASRTMGASDVHTMFRHILPNAIGTVITQSALSVPGVVFQEAGLSYLGLGVQAPNPSIGVLLSDGQKILMEYPYMIVSPGIVIVLLMLAFNLMGNGLRDAFNPALRQ